MRRHRSGAPPPESSSSDEEDAFSALSRRKKKRGRKSLPNKGSGSSSAPKEPESTPAPKPTGPTNAEGAAASPSENGGGGDNAGSSECKTIASATSSTKRHHHKNAARAARMDALLQELQAEKTPGHAASGAGVPGHYGPENGGRPPPDKKGSFVEAGEEHLTTNIFVGNLAPCVTEEELTDAFRQFGDLYSVKIMWPRTPEERARNRNTGFVCFMTRADAQEAMDAFQDADPLECGRRMVLRWGKNVKKTVKRGTGGVPIPPIRQKDKVSKETPKDDQRTGESNEQSVKEDESNKRRKTEDRTSSNDTGLGSGLAATSHESMHLNSSMDVGRGADGSSSAATRSGTGESTVISEMGAAKSACVVEDSFPEYDPNVHSADAIRVVSPTEPRRLKFITTVASFIARDGSLLERKLIDKESGNPDFAFLMVGDELSFASTGFNDEDEEQATKRNEWIFYRWRVYSFAQGDGFDSWRTKPFVMFQPYGRYWIPPPLNQEAARREEEAAKRKEDEIRSMQEERRRLAEKKDFMTGRQLEHAKFGVTTKGSSDGSTKLTEWEKEKFDELLRKKLCASRESICEAMAFCFDKSGAAKEISLLLKEALLEDGRGVSADTRIARLYLLSDVLFNSQQPGVRNAFRYRDAIEAMSPEVFDSLGKHGNAKGRMTMNKLRKAVSGVLSAWTNWSVYNATFLDELHARFEGKEVKAPIAKPEEPSTEDIIEDNTDDAVENNEAEDQVQVDEAPRDGWTDAELIPAGNDVDGEPLEDDGEVNVDGEELCEDDNIDGEPLTGNDTNVDGEALADEDVDGEMLEDEDVDGEALDQDDVDGEPL